MMKKKQHHQQMIFTDSGNKSDSSKHFVNLNNKETIKSILKNRFNQLLLIKIVIFFKSNSL